MGRNIKCDFKQLDAFAKNLEKLNQEQKQQFMVSCTKELAARLLAKVIQRTHPGRYPASTGKTGGTLRRGWETQLSNGFSVNQVGDSFVVELINPTEYASYVEYGHRKSNHQGWVEGKFYLTISEQENEAVAPAILERELMRYLSEIFK